MIWDSAPWRTDLLRDAHLIEKWSKRSETPRRQYILEKKVFYTAFSIRKLCESRKIIDRDAHASVNARAFPTISIPTRYRWIDLDHYFDMGAFEERQVPARDLINYLIHSFIFAFQVVDTGDVAGFFVASDRSRKSEALLIEIQAYCDLCRFIASSRPNGVASTFDDHGHETITVT